MKSETDLSTLQLYKSVAIRDTRLSLELNANLWRLSWITFIFLPLTFLSGFFGMNVDLFADEPSIKWYFVAAVVLVSPFAATLLQTSALYPGRSVRKQVIRF